MKTFKRPNTRGDKDFPKWRPVSGVEYFGVMLGKDRIWPDGIVRPNENVTLFRKVPKTSKVARHRARVRG